LALLFDNMPCSICGESIRVGDDTVESDGRRVRFAAGERSANVSGFYLTAA
jgi:hypothetical protein